MKARHSWLFTGPSSRLELGDPIWVKKTQTEPILLLKAIGEPSEQAAIENEAPAPEGVSFESVQAHVVDDSVSDLKMCNHKRSDYSQARRPGEW